LLIYADSILIEEKLKISINKNKWYMLLVVKIPIMENNDKKYVA
jgi:hypothetical protein